MVLLIPLFKVADVVFILSGKLFALYAIHRANGGNANGGVFYGILLKNLRTLV